MKSALMAAIALLATWGSARADPTIYTDQASWAASMPGDTIAPLTGTLVATYYETTIVTNLYGGRTVGATVPVTTTVDATNFGAQMNFGSGCDLEAGCVITAPLEIVVLLGAEYDGFFADVGTGWPGVSVNGIPLPYYGGVQPWGISGAGPITELDFVSDAGFTDNPVSFGFSNILVATFGLAPVPAPSGALLLPLALLGFALRRRT